ncbi:MAG: AAA family ATPase [Terracoccus sp.]
MSKTWREKGCATPMFGRERERAEIDGLLDQVLCGRSRSLVVTGETGLGKTTLLSLAEERAERFRVVRITGIESEMEYPLAGLGALWSQLDIGVINLPGPQDAAVEVALGHRPGPVPDQFLVALALLTALSEASQTQPILCAVDDVQWLDRGTRQALGFTSRRLHAESVAMIYAVRRPHRVPELDGLDELTLGPLPDSVGAELLRRRAGLLDELMIRRILRECRGNPLVLEEVSDSIVRTKLGTGYLDFGKVTEWTAVERLYAGRVAALPSETRLLLLVASADLTGDVGLLWSAAARLGVEEAAAEPAVCDELLRIGDVVAFRHPLIRSTVYRGAPPGDRKRVHLALADSIDASAEPDRHSWHLARAATRPDETLAFALEQSAGRALSRGGSRAAALFLRRSAMLTPDPTRRGERALAAADAAVTAGEFDDAIDLLTLVEQCPADSVRRGRVQSLRARISFLTVRGADAVGLYLDAARWFDTRDPLAARQAYLDAFEAADFAGRLSTAGSLDDVATAALAAPKAPDPPRAIDLLLDGVVARQLQGGAAGIDALKAAIARVRNDRESPWIWTALRMCIYLWDDESWELLARRAVSTARQSAALAHLPVGLEFLAGLFTLRGEFATAAVLMKDHDDVVAVAGVPPRQYVRLLIAAWTAGERNTQHLIDRAIAEGSERGEGNVIAFGNFSRAVFHNGHGRYQLALTSAQASLREPTGRAWAPLELIEAASHVGAPGVARLAQERLVAEAEASGTHWALGRAARCRALLGNGPTMEDDYQQSLYHLNQTPMVADRARSQLLYGEWLRRQNRRVDTVPSCARPWRRSP